MTVISRITSKFRSLKQRTLTVVVLAPLRVSGSYSACYPADTRTVIDHQSYAVWVHKKLVDLRSVCGIQVGLYYSRLSV